jgi:KaiC/GvpD/RAD55 family RecA-like ATPase
MKPTSNYQNKNYLILGESGMGKTTLMKHFLYEELKKDKNLILYLPADYHYKEVNLINLLLDEEAEEEDIPFIIKEKMKKSDKESAIFIDEIDSLNFTKDLQFVYRFARNYKANVYAIAKSTADIHKIAVRQAQKLFIFRHTEENDLQRLKLINSELYKKVPELERFQAIVIEDRKIIAEIQLEFDIPKLDKLIEDELKNYLKNIRDITYVS